MEKYFTNVTEFSMLASNKKTLFVASLDSFSSVIITYNLFLTVLVQVKTILEKAFTEEHYEHTIFHSFESWQYQY